MSDQDDFLAGQEPKKHRIGDIISREDALAGKPTLQSLLNVELVLIGFRREVGEEFTRYVLRVCKPDDQIEFECNASGVTVSAQLAAIDKTTDLPMLIKPVLVAGTNKIILE